MRLWHKEAHALTDSVVACAFALVLLRFARASAIDPRAAEHAEINFVFEDDNGEPADLEHASVDTRVPCEGKLVIWLMAHNAELFGATAPHPPPWPCRG